MQIAKQIAVETDKALQEVEVSMQEFIQSIHRERDIVQIESLIARKEEN